MSAMYLYWISAFAGMTSSDLVTQAKLKTSRMSFGVHTLVTAALLFLTLTPAAHAVKPEDLIRPTRLALEQALYALPESQREQAIPWLLNKSAELRKKWRNEFFRLETLAFVYREAKRNDLNPELVLAVIQVESTYDRKAISNRGARGLMQVMPFWTDELDFQEDAAGENEDGSKTPDLFHPETNIRYGCAILKRYLERSKGDLVEALARYNGSRGQIWYPNKVYLALKNQILN